MTIYALSSGPGVSGVAVIRISGSKAIKITNTIFSKDISKSKSHTIHFGNISDKNIIDEVLVSIFRNNNSNFCIIFEIG